jgi:[CysO sulfur-carrier protein]-S-L-cysteine hydrolase
MSGRPDAVAIPHAILAEVFRHARAAFPAECCGWLAGRRAAAAVTRARPCRNAQPDGDHPTAADRGAETAYVIAGEDLLELARALDGPEPPQVIYHSHPNGHAYFSATDAKVATDPWGEGPMYPVQQLVVGIDAARVIEAKLFAWDDAERGFIEVARFEGGNW